MLLESSISELVLTAGGIAAGAALLVAAAVAAIMPEPVAADAEVDYFLCRLVLPRATFLQFMTPAERDVMKMRVAYWEAQAEAGRAAIFAAVEDGTSTWGVLILRVRSEAEAQSIMSMDPAIIARIGMRYDIHRLQNVLIGGC